MASNADENLLDLQALSPQPLKLKLPDGSKEVSVNPPRIEQTLRIGFLAQKLHDIQNIDSLTEEVTEKLKSVMNDLEAEIKKVVPELEPFALNMLHISKLAEFIGEMGAPGQSKALAEQGVEIDGGPKVSPTSESLVS